MFAWWCALIVTVGALPVGIIRILALRAGGAVPDRAVRISGWFAIWLGALALVVFLVLTVVIALR